MTAAAHQRIRRAAAVYVAAILLCLVSACHCIVLSSKYEPNHGAVALQSNKDSSMTQEQILALAHENSHENSPEEHNRAINEEVVRDVSSLPEESAEWPPWPWHHKNNTDDKNGTDDGGDSGGGGGGHHWPWPWPHPTPAPPPGPPGPSPPDPTPVPPAPSPDDDKNKTDTSCASHTNCTSCTESSWGCHWCAYDEACHAKGSVHGCIAGVNCYRQDRCTRKEPEPIRGYDISDVGTMPLLVILGLAGLVICCASCCYGVACCMRGTYEDYATLAVANNGGDSSVMIQNGQRPRTISFQEEVVVNDDDDGNVDDDRANEREQEGTEYQRLLDDGVGMPPGEDEESLHTRITAARSQVMVNSSNTKCMFKACSVCYAVTVFCVGILAVMGVVYSPRRPDISVCSDALAWKSIVDGMTSVKMQASFQIVMSVQNPNRFDVVLDMASGSFKHDGAQVGTFTVPRTSIQSMAITDLLVSVTFTPDKWEALQLTAEYYKGTLTFRVDMAAAVQIPALANFTYDFEMDNYKVLAADPKLQDRHLCYCPDKNGQDFVDSPLAIATAAELFPIEYN